MNECPKCGNKAIWGVQYSYGSSEMYDGISEWWCNPEQKGCGYRQGRWTGLEIKDGYLESRYGERGVVKAPAK